jgi:predicted nucleic acid-binding protein
MPDVTVVRPSLIFDTTVLSNFAAVGQIPLLEPLYRGNACTTLMVLEEILRGLDAGYEYLRSARDAMVSPSPAGWLPILAIETAEEQALYGELSPALGAGEASCVAAAITRGLTLASDDLAARRMAAKRDVRLTGTIGILVRLVREDRLSLVEANAILAQMIKLRYRSPVERVDNLI